MDESEWYAVSADGRIIFTEEGRREIAPHLARAGIDLRSIRTWDDYCAARARAAPFLQDTLLAIVAGKPMTLERQALVVAVTGDDATFDRLLRQIEGRARLRVV